MCATGLEPGVRGLGTTCECVLVAGVCTASCDARLIHASGVRCLMSNVPIRTDNASTASTIGFGGGEERGRDIGNVQPVKRT